MENGKVAQINRMGMALADPNRVRALMALRGGERCVCEIIELLNLAPSTVSKHMSILKQAGLVSSRKDSRWVYYTLAENKRDRFVGVLSKLVTDFLGRDPAIEKDGQALAHITRSSGKKAAPNRED